MDKGETLIVRVDSALKRRLVEYARRTGKIFRGMPNVSEAARELIEKGLGVGEPMQGEGGGAESRIMQLMLEGFDPCEIVAMGYNIDLVNKCYSKFLEWGRLEMLRLKILGALTYEELWHLCEDLMREFQYLLIENVILRKALPSGVDVPFLLFLAKECREKKFMPSRSIEDFTGASFMEVLENPKIFEDKLREKRLGSLSFKCNT